MLIQPSNNRRETRAFRSASIQSGIFRARDRVTPRRKKPENYSLRSPRAQLESLGADDTPDGEMDLDGVFDDDSDARNMLKELEGSTVEDVTMRARLLENEIRVLRDESNRLALDLQSDKEKVKENMEKIKMNKQLPYLVGNVVEILDLKPEVRARTPPRLAALGSPPRRARTHQI